MPRLLFDNVEKVYKGVSQMSEAKKKRTEGYEKISKPR
jgi:hypothetical protein